MTDTNPEVPRAPITQLSRAQRRVLGVLLEKAFTTPEVYPLTLKSMTSGCNQKSNRDPVVNYDEELVEGVLDELRILGLVAIVHTETGRSARYRHYMRKCFTLTEPQLAIITELLLRGEQSMGELRTRASRMVPIDSLEQLRTEFSSLMELKLARANGPLERRGVLVDHALYPPLEQRPLRALAPETEPGDESASFAAVAPRPLAAASPREGAAAGDSASLLRVVETTCQELRQENRQLQAAFEALKEDFERLSADFEELRRALGG